MLWWMANLSPDRIPRCSLYFLEATQGGSTEIGLLHAFERHACPPQACACPSYARTLKGTGSFPMEVPLALLVWGHVSD